MVREQQDNPEQGSESTARLAVRKERVYAEHPPARVWVALTDPRAIAEWLMPNNFEPTVGHSFRFEVDPTVGSCGVSAVACEVLEVVPERRLVYSWVDVPRKAGVAQTRPGRVIWELEPTADGRGSVLRLTHEGVEVMSWLHRMMIRFGWGTMVKRWIPKVAARVGADGVFVPGAIPLNKRAYRCNNISAEMVR